MRIGIVGGAEKSERNARYEALARARGCSVEFHDGHMEGRGSQTLRTLIERSDMVVIVTRVNSHNAVRKARHLLRRRGCKGLIVPRFGLSHFESVLRGEPRAGTLIHAT